MLYLLITLFIGLSGSLYITKKDLATAQAQAGLMQCEADIKQGEIAQLEQASNQMETELKSVLNRIEIVSELNAEHRQKSEQDQKQFQAEIKLIRDLNSNENEPIRNWVDDLVPIDAVGMLRYARTPDHNQNSNSHEASSNLSTGRTFQPVSGNRDF